MQIYSDVHTKWWFVLFSHRFIINQILLTVALKSEIFFRLQNCSTFFTKTFFLFRFTLEIMPVFYLEDVNIIYVCSLECDILHKCRIDVKFMFETFVLFIQWCMSSTTIFSIFSIFFVVCWRETILPLNEKLISIHNIWFLNILSDTHEFASLLSSIWWINKKTMMLIRISLKVMGKQW